MTKPISIVIPALSDVDLFEKHLPPLLAEVERRDVGDEVIVVDDTGEDVLRPWFAVSLAQFPIGRDRPTRTENTLGKRRAAPPHHKTLGPNLGP